MGITSNGIVIGVLAVKFPVGINRGVKLSLEGKSPSRLENLFIQLALSNPLYEVCVSLSGTPGGEKPCRTPFAVSLLTPFVSVTAYV